MKAKSRLSPTPSSQQEPNHQEQDSVTLNQRSQPSAHHRRQSQQLISSHLLSKYLSHLKTLFLCLPFYGVVWYIVTQVPPVSIKNWLIPNLYLPFQVSLFMANVFLFSFLLLNSRRGLLVATGIQALVFFKLQSVQFTWQLTLGIIGLFAIIELIQTALTRFSTGEAFERKLHHGKHSRR